MVCRLDLQMIYFNKFALWKGRFELSLTNLLRVVRYKLQIKTERDVDNWQKLQENQSCSIFFKVRLVEAVDMVR